MLSTLATLRQTRLTRSSILGALLSIVVLLVLLVVLLLRFYSATSAVITTVHQQKTIIGQLAGHPAPDFTIPLWNGTSPAKTIHLAALRGSAVVVNFWASWCDPCHGEAPILAQVAKTYAGRRVVFVGIALETNEADGREFLQQYQVPYDCGPAPDSLAMAYGLTGIPVTVAINAKGVLVRELEGPVTAHSLGSAIQAALG